MDRKLWVDLLRPMRYSCLLPKSLTLGNWYALLHHKHKDLKGLTGPRGKVADRVTKLFMLALAAARCTNIRSIPTLFILTQFASPGILN